MLPTDRLGTITQPILVTTEGTITSPHLAGLPSDYFDRAAKAIAAATPETERHTLDGQGHVVAPELMARVLKTFSQPVALHSQRFAWLGRRGRRGGDGCVGQAGSRRRELSGKPVTK